MGHFPKRSMIQHSVSLLENPTLSLLPSNEILYRLSVFIDLLTLLMILFSFYPILCFFFYHLRSLKGSVLFPCEETGAACDRFTNDELLEDTGVGGCETLANKGEKPLEGGWPTRGEAALVGRGPTPVYCCPAGKAETPVLGRKRKSNDELERCARGT